MLAIFLFNSIGYYFLFEMSRQKARNEMQTTIQRHSLRIVTLSIADIGNDREFQKINDKEFRYKGVMYDLVQASKIGNTTVFYCFHDVKESKLFSGLERLTRGKQYLALWNQFVMFFCPDSPIDLRSHVSGNLLFPLMVVSLRCSNLQPWSPPPERM
jgi:hypothetical protein